MFHYLPFVFTFGIFLQSTGHAFVSIFNKVARFPGILSSATCYSVDSFPYDASKVEAKIRRYIMVIVWIISSIYRSANRISNKKCTMRTIYHQLLNTNSTYQFSINHFIILYKCKIYIDFIWKFYSLHFLLDWKLVEFLSMLFGLNRLRIDNFENWTIFTDYSYFVMLISLHYFSVALDWLSRKIFVLIDNWNLGDLYSHR